MLFKQNDNNKNRIHLGNYEEFFILYMDGELSNEQMKMVDDFLIVHKDLQAEFEMLMNTKLPLETFRIDKEELLSGNMKLSTLDENLLLYIDKELTADKKNIVEFELASNKNYQLQHQFLLKTKLDAGEKIVFPHKEELYRKTERRVVAFKRWMRIAAAAIIVAAVSVLFFTNYSSPTSETVTPIAKEDGKEKISPKENLTAQKNPEQEKQNVVVENNLNKTTIAIK